MHKHSAEKEFLSGERKAAEPHHEGGAIEGGQKVHTLRLRDGPRTSRLREDPNAWKRVACIGKGIGKSLAENYPQPDGGCRSKRSWGGGQRCVKKEIFKS